MDDDRNIKCEDCSNRDASTVKCKSVYEKQNPVTVKKNPPLAQLDRWRSIYKDSANTDDCSLSKPRCDNVMQSPINSLCVVTR